MWDERYSDPEYAYGTAPNDFLVQQARLIPAGPVLCLAEGEGRNAVWLAEHGHDVTAVDASRVGLEKAQRLAATRGTVIETICSDLAEYSIAPGAWAAIVSIFAHVPPDLRRATHRQVVAGLQPGGVLILEAYTPAQVSYGTGGPPSAEMMMDMAGLRTELEGLELVVACERERAVHEGKYHCGLAHVVQVVGRKPAQ
ncbi:class I SAM-dependent methyltransferase [Ectothiorhodospiraceae bacterium WFHF3C12]|nr:class I SAM-dependent methyltransferase [Ectothiorhodospiraceae bacterium WFHF3C12]